jgi:hypothetical protein
MRPVPEDLPPPSWRRLQELLAGYFAARARGLFASEFVLSSRGGESFGRLRIHGPKGAQFEAGSVKATIERSARSRYRMLIGDTEMLVAEPAGSSGEPKVRCGNRLYETRFNLLRNAAVARSSGGEEAARIAGGLTNLSYEAFFDRGSLPVAAFLLYRLVALRRRAFLADVGGSGATEDHD